MGLLKKNYNFSTVIFVFLIRSQYSSEGSVDRRQGQAPSGKVMPEDEVVPRGPVVAVPSTPSRGGGAKNEKNRFTIPSTSIRLYHRTTPLRVSFEENCDYLAHYCLKAYDTGKLCGRTIYYVYHTFTNYCLMDYVNCMERYEVWQVVHMGECFNVTELTEYLLYPYDDDYFLDQYYVVEDH